MNQNSLFDIRSVLWRRSFENALPFEQYVATGSPAHQEKWRASADRVVLTEEIKTKLSTFKRAMRVLALSGTWCGDCSRQGPMLEAIASAAPGMELRFIDNQADDELRDELRIHGAARVPVVVTISEDFFEVGRSSDRTLSVYRAKAVRELGAACDAGIVPPAADEVATELNEWVEHFERQQLLLRVSPFLRNRHND